MRPSAPRLSVTSVCAALPAARRKVGLIEVQRDGVDEALHVVDLTRGAALERHRADLFEVEHVGAEHDGHVHRAGLEQILPAVRHEAAADERDVCGCVEPLQLAHRVADEHLRVRRATGPACGCATPRRKPS